MSGSEKSSDTDTVRENASSSSLEDDKFVKRAIEGDQEAFKDLMDKYQKPLYFHVLKMVKNHEQVEDLVQEAFMKAFRNLNSYNTNYAFSTWLYRITTNHTIDYLRKKKLKTTSIDQPVKTRDGEMEIQISDDAETDRNIIRKERKKIIHNAINDLPEKYRRVIEMRHLQELSYQEIADQLDLPLGTVKAHIFRAREMLYKELKDKREKF
ncbi:RNA polymerase sigma factor [Rhodohalobacter sulfatireducens]|uniref:RNA polymerase sigma factor n=1 Tax=Rhodohalobacter sulfatireducens TaxID=2911366 RepID=A0ABS9KG38_9BACT|nr:sigma-70 family RNA polymerase sigma factor [Rhodohalobacter sulfatireducens]MCG2589823.1 sigma-70 family RNA polymerase sigma factor [Rhodohalobacter sulfatireducens]MDR9367273.1 sigma-70 family RNA polymerase sigma factor [Balneolaceae bacterium]MDR9410674.1 sigma-70 family RNA polymerase sigma factor [Balneolaceae bacterium]